MECRVEKNKEMCSCSYPCPKRGYCCLCVEHHRKNGEIPGCFFTKEGEKTYNRSASNFCKTSNI